MIYIKQLVKKLSNFDLEVSLDIKKSEILGILGQSGSGKSTLLRLIQGLDYFDSGDIEFNEKITSSLIFQEYNLLYNKNVFDNVALPLILKKKFDKEKVLNILSFVNLSDKKYKYISSLSGGEKQRVTIARALIDETDLILCDEITANLDEKNKNEILKLLLEINRKYKRTIIMVSHEIDVIKKLCDRVLLISEGKIVKVVENLEKKEINLNNSDYTSYILEVFNV